MAKYELSKATGLKPVLIGTYATLGEAISRAYKESPDVELCKINDWTSHMTGLEFYISKTYDPFIKIEQVEK
jgi:hypothetical protein